LPGKNGLGNSAGEKDVDDDIPKAALAQSSVPLAISSRQSRRRSHNTLAERCWDWLSVFRTRIQISPEFGICLN